MAPNTRPMDPAPSDAELVARTKRGGAEAFDALFSRHYARVYNFAQKMVGNADDAADIAQTSFVRAYESLHRLRDGQAFLGWVYRIVVNLIRDRARSARRKPWVALSDMLHRTDGAEEPMEMGDATLDPQHILSEDERNRALAAAIAELPLEFREAIALYHFQGLDVREIAGITGVAEGTVKSRLGRARMRLRKAMACWYEEGPRQ